MEQGLQVVVDAINDLAKEIGKSIIIEGVFPGSQGPTTPPLTKTDLINVCISISNKLEEYDVDQLDEQTKKFIEVIPHRIMIFKTTALTQANSNIAQVSSSFFALVAWINTILEPIFKWQILADNKLLPQQLTRRLQIIQTGIDNLLPDKELLEKQLFQIKEATDAADNFPVTLDNLKQANLKVDGILTKSAELKGKVEEYSMYAQKYSNDINLKKLEADKIVEQCHEAYRIATTTGLAGAFDQRAKDLSNTMYYWVGGLVFSLLLGVCIGNYRFQKLSEILLKPSPNWGVIWLEFTLSILGLAAPLWLAWLATRKIGQYFRLAEDYAFKSSISKAYEGYRREAARIDPNLEARLFASALTRLDEAPLRLVGDDNFSSPFHEFFSSKAFQSALQNVPELKDKFNDIVKSGIDKLPSASKENSSKVE